MGQDCSHAENLSKYVTLSDDPTCTGAVWWELWRSKLGSRCEYQKPRLNLGPIISAPAAKGNFSTSPHNSHHLWGFGLWRHTQGVLLLDSDRMPRSFVLFFRQSMFCLQDAQLAMVTFISSMFMQSELSLQSQAFHWQNKTEAWNAHMVHKTIILNDLSNAKSLSDFKMDLLHSVVPCQSFFTCAFVCRCWFYTMQSRHAGYFYSLPSLPLSHIGHTTLVGTWSQSTAPSVPV